MVQLAPYRFNQILLNFLLLNICCDNIQAQLLGLVPSSLGLQVLELNFLSE